MLIPGGQLRPVLIDDPARLRAISDDWRSLLERSSTNELSVHPDWMLPWWDAFGDSGKRSLRSIAFFEGDRMVGLAPLLARPNAYRLGIRSGRETLSLEPPTGYARRRRRRHRVARWLTAMW